MYRVVKQDNVITVLYNCIPIRVYSYTTKKECKEAMKQANEFIKKLEGDK